MAYPLELNFKKIALARQATLTDAQGQPIAYARQKVLKLKEEIEVFRDKTKAELICTIKANKVIDFSSAYNFLDPQQQSFGSIQRQGMRSLWKATYLLNDPQGNHYATIREEKPFAKVIDATLGEIPLMGLFCNYFFNPSYLATNEQGTPIIRITKSPSFWGKLFKIDKLADVDPEEEIRYLMSLLMMIFLEQKRG